MRTKNQILTVLVERINDRLVVLSYTAEKAARESGLDRKSLRDVIDRGHMPNLEKLSKIADGLNCTIAYLIGETDNPGVIDITTQNFRNSGETGTPLYAELAAALDKLQAIDQASIRPLREIALGIEGAQERVAILERTAAEIRRTVAKVDRVEAA